MKGGDIRVEDSPGSGHRVQMLGVVDNRVFYAVDGQVKTLPGDGSTSIEGDASGMHVATRVAAGDLYVLLHRFVGNGVFEDVLVRLRRGATTLERLPYVGRGFDIDGEQLYFAAKDGIRSARR